MDIGVVAGRRDRMLSTAVLTLLLIVLLFEAAILAPSYPDTALNGDFISFWTGASLLREGVGPMLFDMDTQAAYQIAFRRDHAVLGVTRNATIHNPYHTPPPLALLLVPLTYLPFSVAFLIWTALSLLGFVLAVALPLRGRALALTPAALMLSFIPLDYSILSGQVNVIFVLPFSLSLMAFASGRPFLGGLVLGMLWLKPQYAVIFPVIFLLKHRWQELAGMVVAGGVVALLSVATIGISGIVTYLEVLRRIGAFYPPEASCINAWDMVNWRALLTNLWPGIPDATGSVLTMALGATTILASLLAWRGPWEPDSSRFPRQMLVATLATLVASPHSHFAGMVLMLAPVALGLANPPSDLSARRQWHRILWAGYIASLLAWPLAPSLLPVQSTKWLLGPGLLVVATILVAKMWTKPVFESHAPQPTK